MKALVIVSALDVGGAELYVERLVGALKDQCEFTVALPNAPNMIEFGQRLRSHARVVSDAFDRFNALPSLAIKLRSLARQHDVIHLNSNHPCSRLGIAFAFALARVRPTVCVEQRVTPVGDISVPRGLEPVLPVLFRWSRRSVARLIAVSRENADLLTTLYKIPRGKISVVHNGSDFQELDEAQARLRRQSLRAELGLRPDQPIVLVLARIAPNKGHRFLVDAAHAILDQHPNAHFVFAGALDDAQRLMAQVDALGLKSAFSLLGFRTDTQEMLAAADVFVLPSLAEGFSLSIVEALAAGLPVIATRVGGASEAIEHGRNGFLVPPADSAALAQALLHALSMSESERMLISSAARKSAAQFSTAAMAAKTFAVYRQVVRK